jgi:hypothetical protein
MPIITAPATAASTSALRAVNQRIITLGGEQMNEWRRIGALAVALAAGGAARGAPPAAAAGGAAGSTAAPAQPAGTQRMVELLQRVAREADPLKNPYLNTQRVAMMRRAAAENPAKWSHPNMRFQLAAELLFAGESEASLQQIEAIEQYVRETKATLRPEDARQLRDLKAIALFRIAEQENCCARHSPESCLVPIRGQGIHTEQRGSRGAIEVLTQALEADPDDLASRWLLNIGFMTLGEYPDSVPQRWLIPPSVFASEYDIGRFPDVAGALGLDVVGLAGGAIMEDFDGDGNLDVMRSSWGLSDQLRYFRNNADGTFTERTAEAGLLGITGGLNITHADFNNDGHPDVLVLRGAWFFEEGKHPKSLLKNNGDGTFEDVTFTAGMLSPHPTQTAAWADFDNDGWLDVFIGHESWAAEKHPCELYRNNRDGTFTECAASAGVAHVGFIKGVASGDYDNDGLPDLYLSDRGGPNVLFHNDGALHFSNVSKAAGVDETVTSFPTWFFDYDNDGWLDIFVSGFNWSSVGDGCADYLGLPHKAAMPRLYRNRGDGTFADVTAEAGLHRLLLAMGSNYGDLDNDGWLDFYLGTGEPDYRGLTPNRVFRNAQGRSFQDVTTSGGFGNIQKGHGVAFGDLDNDGDQDILVTMGGAYSGDTYHCLLHENPGHGNHWITLRLEGVRTNRMAMGARIRVRVETAEGERDIHVVAGTGGSFGSSSLQQEIGLGRAKSIRFVEVFWPVSGETQRIELVSMDRVYLIREGDAQAVAVTMKRM